MRILTVSNFFPPHVNGGAELIAHAHARRLAQRGCAVSVFTGAFTHDQVAFPHVVRESFDGLDVYRVVKTDRGGWGRVNFVDREVERLFDEVLDEVRPDIVHCHLLTGLSVGVIGRARRAGVRVALIIHDSWAFCFKGTFLRPNGQVCDDFSACSQCLAGLRDDHGRTFPIRVRGDYIRQQFDDLDALISPSEFLAEAYLTAGFQRDDLHIVGNGVDRDRFAQVAATPRPEGRVRFTFVGFVGPHKGIATLLEACAKLPRDSGAIVNVVGAGPMEVDVRAAVETGAARCKIVPWGRVPNTRINEVLAATDVLILPSTCPENQPGVILEAMAAGRAVIASRLGGCVELVEDDVTGRLFDAGNANALAQSMQGFLDEPASCTRMGEAGRERIRDFDFDRQVSRLLDVYQGTIAKTAERRESRPGLVLLDGQAVPAREYGVLDRFPDRDTRFAFADWFDEPPANTRALWVVDPSASAGRARLAVNAGIPVIYPIEHLGLSNLPGTTPYSTAEEADSLLASVTGQSAAMRDSAMPRGRRRRSLFLADS